MVEGFVGLPGSGKTYYISKLALEEIKKGRKVYANYKLEGATYYEDLKEVCEVEKGIILVDEINLTCPSRWWDRFPPHLAYFWSQTRKQELDVYWTAQHQDRVDKIVREISNWIWKINYLPFRFRIMTKYLPEQINKVKKEKFGVKIFHIKKEVFKHYNTYERIRPAKYTLQEHYRYRRHNYSPFAEKIIQESRRKFSKPKIFAARMKEMDEKYGPEKNQEVKKLPLDTG